jgi:type IV pilus assembly protein PilA
LEHAAHLRQHSHGHPPAQIHHAPAGALSVTELAYAVSRQRWQERRARLLLAARVFVLWMLMPAILLSVCGAAVIDGSFTFKCRARQSEAKTNLKSMYVAQEAFHQDHGRYARTTVELNVEGEWQSRGNNQRYRYLTESTDPDTFTGYAIANKAPMTGDFWSMTQDNYLTNEVNACE